MMSLSARRAWIEMWYNWRYDYNIVCRSPQGERGLKLILQMKVDVPERVALRKESVD